jgi:hypothetical protein
MLSITSFVATTREQIFIKSDPIYNCFGGERGGMGCDEI